MCAWAVVAGVAISVVGGALLSDDNGAGDANAAAGDATRTQSAIAQDQWDTYKQIYQPLEKSYAADAQTFASAANRECYAGQAQASVAQQYGLAHERLARTLGLDTSSSAYAVSLVGLDMHQAAASATGQNAARYRVDDMGWARRTDALSLGKGLPAQAAAGLAQAYRPQPDIHRHHMMHRFHQRSIITGVGAKLIEPIFKFARAAVIIIWHYKSYFDKTLGGQELSVLSFFSTHSNAAFCLPWRTLRRFPAILQHFICRHPNLPTRVIAQPGIKQTR